ncbi:hypothetical protein K438DRAFT_1793708 [Mycena galopus ATCC 62051]|nr:hypothetical protein K438DRAFT_1793708 [Mycena galopus ATCC 62051]
MPSTNSPKHRCFSLLHLGHDPVTDAIVLARMDPWVNEHPSPEEDPEAELYYFDDGGASIGNSRSVDSSGRPRTMPQEGFFWLMTKRMREAKVIKSKLAEQRLATAALESRLCAQTAASEAAELALKNRISDRGRSTETPRHYREEGEERTRRRRRGEQRASAYRPRAVGASDEITPRAHRQRGASSGQTSGGHAYSGGSARNFGAAAVKVGKTCEAAHTHSGGRAEATDVCSGGSTEFRGQALRGCGVPAVGDGDGHVGGACAGDGHTGEAGVQQADAGGACTAEMGSTCVPWLGRRGTGGTGTHIRVHDGDGHTWATDTGKPCGATDGRTCRVGSAKAWAGCAAVHGPNKPGVHGDWCAVAGVGSRRMCMKCPQSRRAVSGVRGCEIRHNKNAGAAASSTTLRYRAGSSAVLSSVAVHVRKTQRRRRTCAAAAAVDVKAGVRKSAPFWRGRRQA